MRQPRFYLLLLLTLLLKSCEVPDVHPFTQATKEMAGALDESLKQVVADLDKVTITEPESTATRLRDIKAQLTDATQKFGAVAHGFDAYAKALDDVAAAGEDKQKALTKVNEALTGLVAAVPVYGAALKATFGLGGTLATGIAARTTITKLSDLASPAQDSLIQQTARYLRLAMARFAAIDAEAQGLLKRHQAPQVQMWDDLLASSLNRQQQANSILFLITQSQYYLLLNNGTSVLEHRADGKPGLIPQLIIRDQDDQHLISKAWAKAGQKASPELLTNLAQREKFYQQQATISPELRAWQAQVQARPQPANALAKAGPLLATWASTHHKLRVSLTDASHLTGKEALTYLNAAQDLQKEVKALKEAQK